MVERHDGPSWLRDDDDNDLQGNPDQQRFTIPSGVLTGNDTRWRSAISGSPWTE